MAIRPEFEHHNLNSLGQTRTDAVREAFSDLLNSIDILSPGSSRAKSVMITKLQEACSWANRAVAESTENQEPLK